MIDLDQLEERPTRSALRRQKRAKKRALRLLLREEYRQSLTGRRETKNRLMRQAEFLAAEERRLRLLQERQVALAATLAESVVAFEVRFPQFGDIDLKQVRAYMLGESHRSLPLPAELGVAVSAYRSRLLAKQLRTEPALEATKQMSVEQRDGVIDAMIAHFDALLDQSDGLYNCSVWHPACRHTNDHARTRRASRRTSSRRWQRNVLRVYIETVGLGAIVELFCYAQLPLPLWLRKLNAQMNIRLIA